MSYVNVWRATNTADDDGVSVDALARDDAGQYTDGEELMAVHRIIQLLDGLSEGEVIVINRDMF